MTRADIRTKFLDCAALVYSPGESETLFGRLEGIQSLNRLSDLMPLLARR